MKFKKILFVFGIFTLLVSGIPQNAAAQWSIGASYEIRNQAPENGFGVRLERDILSKVPVVNLGLRAHFSYFNEDNYADKSSLNVSGDIASYDYGLAATAGFSLGLVEPYVGTGLGSTTLDINPKTKTSDSNSKLYWNGFVGAQVKPIPLVRPFVEYRFQTTDSFSGLTNKASFSDVKDGNTGRLIFGISLNF